MFKPTFVALFALTCIVATGCDIDTSSQVILQNQQEDGGVQEGTEKDTGVTKDIEDTDGRMDYEQPHWYPHYDLPTGWAVSAQSLYGAFGPKDRDELVFIVLSGYKLEEDTPRQARDAEAEHVVCNADNMADWSPWINCSRPAEIGELEVAGQTVYFLRYWGHWMGPDRKIEEFFFIHDSQVRMITLEGGLDEDIEVVKGAISTLNYQYEVFIPEPSELQFGL